MKQWFEIYAKNLKHQQLFILGGLSMNVKANLIVSEKQVYKKDVYLWIWK